MPEITGKIWGTTSQIFRRNNVELHRIVGKLGGYSSKHRHFQKYNLFIVEKGKILVRQWVLPGDYETGMEFVTDETILNPQDTLTIKPGVWHQFEVLEEGTVAYELYWVELPNKDIVRDGTGGLRNQKKEKGLKGRKSKA